MTSPAYRVLLASPDRCLLRRLARFLHTFAYETGAVAHPSQAESHLVFDPPDILILDENFQKSDPWSLCRELRRGLAGREMQTVAIWDENPNADFTAPLEAGVDEFLAKPVNYGELLARLRSCARRLEFERRLSKQSGLDRQTGLPNSERFWEKLQRLHASGAGKITCAIFEIDGFSAFTLRYGSQAADIIGRAWADLISTTAPGETILGHLGGGRFGAALPNSGESQVTAWRDIIRQKASTEKLEFGGRTWLLTASCAILSLPENGTSIEEFQERLLAAISTASHSGGDYLLLAEDFDKDLRSWTELAAPGKLFEHTTAADIMTPCTVVLREEDTMEKAAAWLNHTHLPALPVTDALGKLRGMITATQISTSEHENHSAQTVKQGMCTDVPTFGDDAPMDTLRDYFALNASRFTFITKDGRTVGWLTPETLMAIIRPIHRDSFTAQNGFTRWSDYLRIPDLSVK